ncbi:hypothetical protein [Haloterrigena salifodinae]|uniref:hypothetical protein n=1 Tax=Haloterrigena salifodinae TaxID=2675099 RepID=UPI000F882039|nr:hypothetical protein [Haloterrigena salifodinae]
MADEIPVRVAGRSFGYGGERYANGDELEVDEATLENHPRTLERVDGPDSGEKPPDPAESTVEEIKAALGDVEDIETAEAMLEREHKNDERDTAVSAIESRIGELEE